MTSPTPEQPIPEKAFSMTPDVKRSWIIAFAVLFTYATLAFIGGTLIMKMEANKPEKFQAIEVTEPISFIDRSYMVDKTDGTQAVKSTTTSE